MDAADAAEWEAPRLVEVEGKGAPAVPLRAPREVAVAKEMPLRAGRGAPRGLAIDPLRAPDPMTKR